MTLDFYLLRLDSSQSQHSPSKQRGNGSLHGYRLNFSIRHTIIMKKGIIGASQLLYLNRNLVHHMQGRIQKFLEGGIWNFFCMDGKIVYGGFWDFFLKKP